MYIEQLYYLAALERAQSLSQAAEMCFVSQPALSKALGNLEKELALRLFERAHDGITLTAKGQDMARYAREIVAILEQMKVYSRVQTGREQLKFAAVPSICDTVLSDALTAFHFRRPTAQVAVKALPAEEVAAEVAGHRADIGLVSLPDVDSRRKKQLMAQGELTFQFLFADPLTLWIGADHPLVRQNAVSVANLLQQHYAYVLAATGYESPQLVADERYAPTIVTANRSLIMKLVQGGNMFSILPSLFCYNEPLIMQGVIKTMPYEAGGVLEYYLLWRRDYRMESAVSDFLAILLQVLTEFHGARSAESASGEPAF